MRWFDITINSLIIMYIFLPIPLTRIIESLFFKTRHLTLVKITMIWFVGNISSLIFLRTTSTLFQTLSGHYLKEHYLILIYTVGLLLFLPPVLKIFLRNRFGTLQVLKISCLYILLFEVVSFSMLGLAEFNRYKHRYAHVVYANSASERKKQILDNFFEWTKLELPDSASLLFANWPKDHLGATKIEIDRKDLLQFEIQLKEKYPQLYSELRTRPLNEEERSYWKWWGPRRFWDPSSAKQFKIASRHVIDPITIRSRRSDLDIVIDLDDEKKAIVYIIYGDC